VSGRARDGRLVHVATGGLAAAPGDVVTSTVTYAAPHHLVADAGIHSHRRWRGNAANDAADHPAAGRLLTIGPPPPR
jgi:tRNA-2-methylthio-N6-dimethylallyladenosine synthase